MITTFLKRLVESMSNFMCFIIVLLFIQQTYSQDYDFDWAEQAGGSSTDIGYGIAVDGSGNTYVTGYFVGTATFGSYTLTSWGLSDIFIAKIDASGKYVWVVQGGASPFAAAGKAIAVDHNGNVYVTGYFYGNAILGGIILASAGFNDVFVAKLDASGNVIWVTTAGGSDSDFGEGIAVDDFKYVYITGHFWGTAKFGSRTLTSNGKEDIFTAYLNPQGEFYWAKQAGGTEDDHGYGIAIDESRNVYVTGDFQDTIKFGDNNERYGKGQKDIFIAKYNLVGDFVWCETAGGPEDDQGLGIAITSTGNVFVTGNFKSSAWFRPNYLHSVGYEDIFIAEANSSNGWILWAKQKGGIGSDSGTGVATDGSGNIFVTGFFEGTNSYSPWQPYFGSSDIFIAKIDNSSEYFGWAKQAGGSGSDRGEAIAVDGSGNVYVSGYFQDTATFGLTTLTGAGNFDIFTTKLKPIGQTTLVVIDGEKDAFYNTLTGPENGYLQLRSYAWNDNGKPDNDADLSAKIWTAWDETWLYTYEEVRDDILSGNATNVWEEDCLEWSIDPQPTSETNSVWQTRLTALDASTAGVVKGDNLDNISDSQKQYVRKIIPGGYALEMAIQWSAIMYSTEIINPSTGSVFGAAINQHDNDGNAKRDASVQWAAVLKDAAWNTPAYLGTVKFLADHKLQFLAKNNITNETNPVPYNGRNYDRTGVEQTLTTLPKTFTLEQNYPNPFNPSTTVMYQIPERSTVSLSVYDVQGRRVRTLVRETVAPGSYSVQWDARDDSGEIVPSGMYLCVAEITGSSTAGKSVSTLKMIYLK